MFIELNSGPTLLKTAVWTAEPKTMRKKCQSEMKDTSRERKKSLKTKIKSVIKIVEWLPVLADEGVGANWQL